MNRFDVLLSTQKKPKLWVNVPHEGPQEYEFDLAGVNFADGITRFILKSEMVPEDYWPRMVYITNMMTGCYECVGKYEYEYEKKGSGGGDVRRDGRDGYRFVAL